MSRQKIRSIAARVLTRPGSMLFARALDLGLKRHLPADVLERLIGRPVEIAVSDWGLRFRFVVRSEGFRSIAAPAAVDVRFVAAARDFALLATGDEDADTLYFSRRVVVEGDTELALLIKNTLDAIEARRLRSVVRRADRLARRVRQIHDRRRPNLAIT